MHSIQVPCNERKGKNETDKSQICFLYQRDPLKRSCNLYNSWIGEVQEQLISSNIKWAAPVAVMNKDKLKWQTGAAKKVTGGWTSLIQKELQNSEQWTVNLWYYNQQIDKIHFQTHNFENVWTKNPLNAWLATQQIWFDTVGKGALVTPCRRPQCLGNRSQKQDNFWETTYL